MCRGGNCDIAVGIRSDNVFVDRSSGRPHVSFDVLGKQYRIYLENGFDEQYAAAPQTGDLILSGLPQKLRESTGTRAILISRSGITVLPVRTLSDD